MYRSSALHPLNQLLEKDHKLEWSREFEYGFKEAKQMVASEQVLAHYDHDLPVRVACDASPYGLGAVLSHVMSDVHRTCRACITHSEHS